MIVVSTQAVGLILTAFVLLQQIALWQRKEYRWDRLRADLTLRPRWRGFPRPRPTPKALTILGISLVLLAAIGMLAQRLALPAVLTSLGLILITPLVAAIAVAAGNGLGEVQKTAAIARARRQRRSLAALIVIGITGSFGKTSTKYFVQHLLSGGDSGALMSGQRRNEAFVVAQDMLQHLTPTTRTYVVEMGAYRRGEIARLADLTQPTIGVVTAIRNQHLALFGSLAAIAAAKWELIESLPGSGIAVLNADDQTIKDKAAAYTGRVIWYSLTHPADVWAERITHEATTSSFILHIGDTERSVTIPLPGEGYVAAAVAATAAAQAAGAAAAIIFDRLASLPPVPQTMAVVTNSHGAAIIDDSYSANEEGVLMALRHLKRFSKTKRVVVLRPLIELGEETLRVHAGIGKALAEADAEVYLYDTAGASDIEQAAKEAGLTQGIHRISAPRALAEKIQHILDANTVCLLENRLPDVVRQAALG